MDIDNNIFECDSIWYKVKEISSNVFWINEPGHVSFYVLRNNDEALFIDSGLGLDINLGLALLKILKIKTFSVYLTHSHCDHVGLNNLADSVFINKEEYNKYLIQNEINQLDGYIEILNAKKKWPLNFEFKDRNNWTPKGFLSSGDKFYFGPWEFRVHQCPGHTTGSLIFFEEKTKFIFLGDLVYSGTLYLNFIDSNFEEYSNSINFLTEFIKNYPEWLLWPSHNGIPLNSNFLFELNNFLIKMNSNKIQPKEPISKNNLFEAGDLFCDGNIKVILKRENHGNV